MALLQTELNRIAEVTDRTNQDCFNILAGTTNRSSQDACNIWAGTTGFDIQDALNVKAGTTNLLRADAAALIPTGGGMLTFYVRPTGTTYGDADGSSYANAWSGFPAVTQANQEAIVSAGGRLAICGTHNQTFTVLASGLTIIGNDVNEAGVIDGGNVTATGLGIDGFENVTIANLTVINHTVNNILLGNAAGTGTYTNIIINGGTFSDSGNQGIQCWGLTGVGGAGVPTATINNPTINGCNDEAISVHQNGNITINGGQYRNNTNAFVNVDITGTSKTVNINDVWDTSGNGVDLQQNTGGTFNVYGSRVDRFTMPASSTINFYNCYVIQSVASSVLDNIAGTLRFYRCLVDCTAVTSTATMAFDMQSGSTLRCQNSIFINVPSGKYALGARAGFTNEGIVNSVFYGVANVGGVIFRATNVTLDNCIFKGLAQVNNIGGSGVCTYNNCNSHDVTTALTGTNNNPIVGDPLFTDASTNDFSLQVGSPCLGATTVVSGFEVGIGSGTDWGSATAAPVVVEVTESGTCNVGAYF
jgi:hypothetical protein